MAKATKEKPATVASTLSDDEWLRREKEYIKAYVNDGEIASKLAQRNLAHRAVLDKAFRNYK